MAVNKWELDNFDSCVWLLACIPTTFVGRANTTSLPTTLVGTAIPTKLVGTIYFDKSSVWHIGPVDHVGYVDPDYLSGNVNLSCVDPLGNEAHGG